MAESGLDKGYVTVVDGAGNAVITISPEGLQQWRVTQVSVELDDDQVSTCVLRKNGRPVAPAVPQLDAVGGEPSVMLRPGDRLTVEWAGATPGLVAAANVFYDEVAW